VADGDGRISGNEATKFFALSNLSRSQLKQLWNLADVKRQGFLGFPEFVTAMQVASLIVFSFHLLSFWFLALEFEYLPCEKTVGFAGASRART